MTINNCCILLDKDLVGTCVDKIKQRSQRQMKDEVTGFLLSMKLFSCIMSLVFFLFICGFNHIKILWLNGRMQKQNPYLTDSQGRVAVLLVLCFSSEYISKQLSKQTCTAYRGTATKFRSGSSTVDLCSLCIACSCSYGYGLLCITMLYYWVK
jgi:hypothetical protein